MMPRHWPQLAWWLSAREFFKQSWDAAYEDSFGIKLLGPIVAHWPTALAVVLLAASCLGAYTLAASNPVAGISEPQRVAEAAHRADAAAERAERAAVRTEDACKALWVLVGKPRPASSRTCTLPPLTAHGGRQ
jgi:hypothetical protein